MLEPYGNPRMIKALIEQIDLEGKDCFWYLQKYEMHDLLSTKIFDLYISFKWEGWIDLNSTVLEFQTSYTTLTMPE